MGCNRSKTKKPRRPAGLLHLVGYSIPMIPTRDLRAFLADCAGPVFRSLCAMLCIALSGSGLATAVPEPSCVRPDADTFLEQTRAAIHFEGSYFPVPRAVFLPLSAGGQNLQWMGTSWEGPIDGALFVVTCAGKQVAALRLGAVSRLRNGPVLPMGATAEIVYVPGQITGEQIAEVGLVRLNGTSIEVLWKHQTSDSVSFPSLGAEYDDTYMWEFSPGGTAIHVSGKRKVGSIADASHGWALGTTHDLPEEMFCWRPTERAYRLCR
jgi:hypothetical protein